VRRRFFFRFLRLGKREGESGDLLGFTMMCVFIIIIIIIVITCMKKRECVFRSNTIDILYNIASAV